MKKLLVLALVLAVSVIANASLVGDITLEGNLVTLNVRSGGGDTALAIGIQGGGSLGDFAKGAVCPPDSAIIGTLEELGLGDLGQGELWTIAYAGTSAYTYQNGAWLTAALTLPADYVMVANLNDATIVVTGYKDVDGSLEALNSIGFAAVPEPITVALLGLGGLFIRRNKK